MGHPAQAVVGAIAPLECVPACSAADALPQVAVLAEGEGFEPPVGFPTMVFKTIAINQTLPSLRGSASRQEDSMRGTPG